jgi:hypothetical protein
MTYTFIDNDGNEHPIPPEIDNDESQFNRGFLGGKLHYDELWGYRPIGVGTRSEKSIAHDLKCESFKRGWEAGYKSSEADWMAWEKQNG